MAFRGSSVDFATFIENETTPHGDAAHESAVNATTDASMVTFLLTFILTPYSPTASAGWVS